MRRIYGYNDRVRRDVDKFGPWLYVVAMLIIFLSFGMRGSCADEEQAIRAAENLGFSEVKVIEKSIWFIGFKGCSASDAALFEVVAKNPVGREVEVGVCVGWPFKGATMRSQ